MQLFDQGHQWTSHHHFNTPESEILNETMRQKKARGIRRHDISPKGLVIIGTVVVHSQQIVKSENHILIFHI